MSGIDHKDIELGASAVDVIMDGPETYQPKKNKNQKKEKASNPCCRCSGKNKNSKKKKKKK